MLKDQKIRILPLPYFRESKMDAFFDRGSKTYTPAMTWKIFPISLIILLPLWDKSNLPIVLFMIM